ncbi:hypothetical protein M422DRAFT_775418 [Sphaerobolus stellatus SS14]|nr:hypothetical protein M422DRAFT_775418 [Sphaerobolus stellatus SS14]
MSHNPQSHGSRDHHHHVSHRTWLPKNQKVLEDWINERLKRIEHPDIKNRPLHPVIQEFQTVIEDDPEIYMAFHMMFEQVPKKPPYNTDPGMHKPQVRDYKTMLKLFDLIIGETPEFQAHNDLVGFPINAILDWPMGTDAGMTAFMNPKVNVQFKKMFDVWATLLSSPESRSVLTTEENGWFGPAAAEEMPNFVQTFECDPDAPYYGFKSWDDFFTRVFRPGLRPVEFENNDSIVNSACESTVYCIASGVKARDKFWLKGEPYSLFHMLNNHSLAPQFVGGTIYQAFLSAEKYHRWHAPVNGTIKTIEIVPGTYYLESPAMGFKNPDGPDPAAENLSQAFITAVAARTLVFIEADNPDIGLMCFMAIGMAEVSTCEVTVNEGDRITKGDQLGMFHFGGSTHCLIFRPETKVTFASDYPVGADVKLNAAIANVSRQ